MPSGSSDPTAVVQWPGDRRGACAFTFDLDAETLWLARGVNEPVALSQGRFGVVDALPGREIAGAYSGPVTVEATAVVFEREGAPAVAIVSALTSDGRRALANTRDASAMQDMTEKAWEGRRVTLRTDGTVNTLDV